ncbi:hypothetical protein ACH5RR_007599 [Cinchona calisaya]|uniref:DUF676 domain-containing protein n=1 Tax=Cinchona calisaya TaxID=153742 RepID=A0ABD3ABT9_9GENT
MVNMNGLLVDMPHQYISSAIDDSSYHGFHGRATVVRKIIEDPAQTAAMRAELHRRSIAQMRINSRSIQDMHIFGDPSRLPIMIVELAVNAPLHSTSRNSYFSRTDQKDKVSPLSEVGSKGMDKISGASPWQSDRVLKMVVFVHGFQGRHLDLRLTRNHWLLIDPKVEFLMSEVNEEKTSGDFREMGQRLAQEVVSFLKKKMDKVSRSGGLRSIKLSFVGHSIGNIILRTALTGWNVVAKVAILSSTWKVCNFVLYFFRERYGTIPAIPLYLCFCFWSPSGLLVQFKFFIQFRIQISQILFYTNSVSKRLWRISGTLFSCLHRRMVMCRYHSSRIEMCQASSGGPLKEK